MRVSCKDSSRVAPRYSLDMAAKYGATSNIYRVRVMGEFPTSEDDVVIPLELCEEAIAREVEPVDSAPLVWGVDVARFGDDRTTLVARKGNVQWAKCQSWRGKDTMQVAGIIKSLYDTAWRTDIPDQINVDTIGIGAGVLDRLWELGLPVKGVNVSESPAIGERYNKLRDELWFKAREWLEERDCKLLDDDDLIGELTAPKYAFTSNGKLKVEAKDEMKKRGLPSPDLADAWIMTFSAPTSKRGQMYSWNQPLEYPDLGLA